MPSHFSNLKIHTLINSTQITTDNIGLDEKRIILYINSQIEN